MSEKLTTKQKIIDLTQSIWFQSIAIFALLFSLALSFLIRIKHFSGEDAYYHVGMAQYMADNHLKIFHTFSYLYFTTLNQNFVDHQYLFHLLIIPFIKIFGAITGAKVMEAGLVAGAFVVFYLVLRYFKIRLAWLYTFTAFFLMPSDFYFRMSFIREQAISLLLITLITLLIIYKKYWALAVISFFFVWLYGGFVLVPVLAIIYALTNLIAKEKVDYKILGFIFAGTILGLIINPYFPKNLSFLSTQLFQTGLGAKSYSGGEWAPYDTFFFLKMAWLPLGLFFLGIFWSLARNIKLSKEKALLIAITFFLLLLQFKSKRYIEYWPFWALLTAIILIVPLLGGEIRRLVSAKGKPFLALQYIVMVYAFAFLGFAYSTSQITQASKDMKEFFDVEKATDVHDYLKTHSDAGDIVFTDDWDVFPLYFFLNQKDNYIVGLDPEFMNQYSSALYKEYAGISSGRDSSGLERIKKDFKAKWVLVARDHKSFKANLEAYPALFENVFENSEYTLYKCL